MVTKRKIDEYYMSRALSLAWRGVDAASPNPRVGCVLVKDGRVVGEGFHARCGGPHAEAAALADAARRGEDVRGATAYVTLEPCSHYGKTPPCAPRLVEEGIARAVVGAVDPNPKVKGAGIEILQNAGVEVSCPCMEKECKWLNRGFFRSVTLNRPWITLKTASSLDGRMALANGESKWITGETARTWAHLLRAEHDGVLVGSGTIRADDPELTVRRSCGKSPLRIILDSNLSISPDCRAVAGGSEGTGKCLVMTCGSFTKNGFAENLEKRRALERAGAEVCAVPEKEARVNLQGVLRELHAREVRSVLVEGGPRVLSAFIEAGLCDSLVLFTAGSVMGEGRGLGDGLSFEQMKDVARLRNVRARRAGSGFLVEGDFQCSPAL
ncbi:MAG: bifunctional diaminohydroxyphosphoribosylaminopyrimidine deaminase/5-amino-6-(5-phosphoribosylamino)uracil reductase RibD [Synergistaceae bacterium]|jgi:diaminohydroxyphosphoribosylaminopyrimidine deaminase/5-amino-6-(5-phosphoribosylamino)uracil reductase|nr:bifunctional diaminohydroxyphosphoribosylaminopyrimidine deaminase/5-amino-6-(5-phosphoribosylamino)uracil reductase RibD [Synergistaceae bacterium]